MSGTVALCAQDTGRYSEFSRCLARLQLPDGWDISLTTNYDLAYSRNHQAKTFEGDYLFFLDDDHAFTPDLLVRLLNRGTNIVGPLYVRRHAPFASVAQIDGEPFMGEEPGLYEVDEIGGSGLLIHRRVFDKLEEPFFRAPPVGEHVSEDYDFCRRARDAGFKVHLDTTQVLSHFTPVAISPMFEDGEWRTVLMAGGAAVQIPQLVMV